MRERKQIKRKGILSAIVFFVSVFFFFPQFASAGLLTLVSDTISDSGPAASSTTHLVAFTTSTVIPASGKIVVTPEGNTGFTFTVPTGFDFSDVTFTVAGFPRSLAASPTFSDDGVSVVTGTNGSITITLASGSSIPAGTQIRIGLGGAHTIVSPLLATSYRIRILTKNAASATLDTGTAMIAIIPSVTLSLGAGDVIPPNRYNGLPSGLLPGSTVNVMVSLNTDAPAECKYGTTTGIGYWSMSSSTLMTVANLGTLHYVVQTVYENDIFDFYVRCENVSHIINTDDYNIHFEVGVIPSASTTPPVTPPSPPAPSGPSGGGGGGGLFLQRGAVTLQGTSIPGGIITVTKDGVSVKEETLSVLGTFDFQFTALDRGTYTWGVQVRDPNGKKSSTYNSTIYLIGGTNNIISPIYVSPTITTSATTIPVGGDLSLSGYAIPLVPVSVIVNKQGNTTGGKVLTASTTANGNGSWSLKIATDDLSKGTYEVKAQSLSSATDRSNFSPVLYIGLGENPNPDFSNRSDLNKDTKVNLVDFSILLFNWKTSDDVADINQDGTVNLTDFSIMLSNWTG